jgi:drug/metabolite transporter (DMT)-like permease
VNSQVLRLAGSGTVCGMLAILLWSTTVALARSLSEQVGPLTSAAAVYLVSGAASTAWLLRSRDRIRQITKLPRAYLIVCGALFALYMLALFLGVGLARNHGQALEVGLLNYLWPALTILFSLLLLNKRANFLLLPATLLALAGVFFVLTQGVTVSFTSFSGNLASNPAAYSLGLFAALSWALYSNLTRRWAGDEQAGAVDLFLPVTGVILLLIRLLASEDGAWNLRACAEALFLGFVTWFAYRLWDIAMRKGDVVLVATCSYLTPFLSTVLSCLYLGVSPGFTLWLGCLLIISGSLLTWASVSDRDGKVQSSPQRTETAEER